MLPFEAVDMGPHTANWDAPWPIEFDAIAPFIPEVERLFCLPKGSYVDKDLIANFAQDDLAFIPKLAKWPNFKRRNIATLLQADLKDTGLDLWLNATVTRFKMADDGALAGLIARSISGARLTAIAPIVILAAGAIESTRLLLLLDQCEGKRIFAPDDVLGRYFHDHLSAPIANMTPIKSALFNRINGFRFEGAGMRNLRFEPSESLRRREILPGGFAHIAFQSTQPGGIDALRNIFFRVQQRALPAPADLTLLGRNAGWLVRAVWQRFVRKRLLMPDNATFELHLVTEQAPHPENHIKLSHLKQDSFGCALAEINWRVRGEDLENFKRLMQFFVEYWHNSRLGGIATLEKFPDHVWKETLLTGGGIYHPCGSIRMGRSPTEGVVDRDLRTFRIPNLRVISTACFPSGGSANPTMTMMLFACRAASDVDRELRLGPTRRSY